MPGGPRRETAEALARIELDLLKPKRVVVDPWGIDWVRAVQGFVLDAPWINDVFRRAMLGADPTRYPEGLFMATGQTPVEFNMQLRKTLEAPRLAR